MTTTPMYTNKAAIIIGTVIALGAGIAVGATFVTNIIDANSLRQYQEGPKVGSLVTLNDDSGGNNAGWNPGNTLIEYQEGASIIKSKREVTEFKISDDSVTKDSIVYASYTDNRNVYPAVGLSPKMAVVDVPCTTIPGENEFTAYCGHDNNYAPREGSQLKYFVIVPS